MELTRLILARVSCARVSLVGGLRALVCLIMVLAATPGNLDAADVQPNIPPVLLKMSRDPAIHTELGLSADQVDAILNVTDQIDAVWWPSRILAPEQQAKIQEDLTAKLWRELVTILDAQQRERVVQLQRQALGTRMFLRAEMADQLLLTEDVRAKLRQLAIETDGEAAELQKQLANGGNAEQISRDLQKLQDRERRGVVGLLTQKQQAQVGMLVGKEFDFSKVTRTQPRAPQFIGTEGEWLQGKPLKMNDLRGKVVVVHFYAFQCINCRRNLPHYNGWHSDFSEEDVVVVGIQTPETASEHDPRKVKQAVSAEDIQYPILFDPELENWKAWGNTMWPTVYLIDRDGFIRTWWQGELNFQGATGEQQYRELIRKMVEESAQGPAK